MFIIIILHFYLFIFLFVIMYIYNKFFLFFNNDRFKKLEIYNKKLFLFYINERFCYNYYNIFKFTFFSL